MSWPLASFLLVGAGARARLAGLRAPRVPRRGWSRSWRRSRRSPRSAATRSSPLPDVKPITAIALVVGYALGAAARLHRRRDRDARFELPARPGPLHALADGGLGTASACSARALGRAQPRGAWAASALALACALAALAAKEIMNLYTWTLGASHTPAAFLVDRRRGRSRSTSPTWSRASCSASPSAPSSRGCSRAMRARMDVSWEDAGRPSAPRARRRRRAAAARSARRPRSALALASAGAPAARRQRPARPPRASVARELSFLDRRPERRRRLRRRARAELSSELYTAWAAIGLAAAGRDPARACAVTGTRVLDALRARSLDPQGPGDVERTILALHACGASPYSFAGRDLVAEVLRRARQRRLLRATWSTSRPSRSSRCAPSATRRAIAAIRDAAGWIERQQNADGGFGFGARGSPSDVDDTGAALQALAAAGARNGARARARRRLPDPLAEPRRRLPRAARRRIQRPVHRLGDPGPDRGRAQPGSVRRRGSRSPLGYLESLLAPGGSVRYSRTSAQTPVWVTAQALDRARGQDLPGRLAVER